MSIGNLGYGLDATINDGDIRLTAEAGDWVTLNGDAWGKLVAFARTAGFSVPEPGEAREFRTRCTTLLAAAAVVGGCEEEYGEKVVTDLARKFEPYLRGEVK